MGPALTEPHEDRLHGDRAVDDMGSRQADGIKQVFTFPLARNNGAVGNWVVKKGYYFVNYSVGKA